MQKAAFSIINYQFEKVNIDLTKYVSNDLTIRFETNGVYIDLEKTFELTFWVYIFNGENAENPFVSVQCKGVFQFEDITSFEEIPNFFYQNSIAILFPYVRAYISLVTTQANIPGVILPTYNLSSLAEDLRKNTTQK